MTKEEAALLESIVREPGENLHRLGYADWQKKNGDPIRVS